MEFEISFHLGTKDVPLTPPPPPPPPTSSDLYVPLLPLWRMFKAKM